MNWAAESFGLAHVDEELKVLLHPLVGPWFTLSAIVVCDLKAMGTHNPPPPLPCPLSDGDRQKVKVAIKEGCTDKLPANVFDAFKVGSKYRFSDDHIKYVNSGNRGFLRDLVNAHIAQQSPA